ncbi:sensor histidine kinase [Calidifontibacter terrae]
MTTGFATDLPSRKHGQQEDGQMQTIERLGQRRWRRALVTCWIVCLPLLAVLAWANRSIPVDVWAPGDLTLGLSLGLSGLLITGRLPGNVVGWFLLLGGATQALVGVLDETVVRGAWTPTGSPSALLWDWLAWISAVISPIGLITLPLVLLHFPDGRLPGPRWRLTRTATYAAGAASMTLNAFAPGTVSPALPSVRNPAGIRGLPVGALYPVVMIATALLILAGLASLVVRWRRSEPEVRQQLRLVVVSAVLLALAAALEITTLLPVSLSPVAAMIFVASVGFAVLRHHLWDTEVVLNVSLVYAVLTLLITGVFVGSVVLTGVLVDGRPLWWPGIVGLGASLLVAVPLHHQVQLVVDRLLYGRGHDPHRVLASLGRRTTAGLDAPTVLQDLVDEIAATYLRLNYVCLTTELGSAQTGTPGAEALTLPIRFQGERIGNLRVSPRQGAGVPANVLSSLEVVVDQIGPVLHSLGVTLAVGRLRQEVTTAREEERRRLRRDIHDGVGPALAAVALQIEGAAALVDRRPQEAKQTLQRLTGEVGEVLNDVRRIVHDLAPPVLEALGLEGALRHQAAAFCTVATAEHDALTVTVEITDPMTDLPAGIELATYRIVCEALTNVTKHAQARSCRVTCATEADQVRLRIDDDGVGFGPGSYGVGTLSMIERATAVGGSCRLLPSPLGGLRVEVYLPVGHLAGNAVRP